MQAGAVGGREHGYGGWGGGVSVCGDSWQRQKVREEEKETLLNLAH